jgi:hypothetical protein
MVLSQPPSRDTVPLIVGIFLACAKIPNVILILYEDLPEIT